MEDTGALHKRYTLGFNAYDLWLLPDRYACVAFLVPGLPDNVQKAGRNFRAAMVKFQFRKHSIFDRSHCLPGVQAWKFQHHPPIVPCACSLILHYIRKGHTRKPSTFCTSIKVNSEKRAHIRSACRSVKDVPMYHLGLMHDASLLIC